MVSWYEGQERAEEHDLEALRSRDELEPPDPGPLAVESVEDADGPLALS